MSDDKSKPGRDCILPLAKTESGDFYAVRHTADHRFETARMRPLKDGAAINGQRVVFAKQSTDGILDVVGEYAPRGGGPAQVATDDYREGWERIFGGKEVASA